MKRITLLTSASIFALIFRISALVAQPVNGLIAHFPMNDKYDAEFTEHQFYGLEHNNEKGIDREGNPQCALYFSGTSFFYREGTGPFNIEESGQKTISLWYKSYIDFDEGTLVTLFGKGVNHGSDYGLFTYDLFKPLWIVGQGNIWYDESAGFVPDTSWHHLAGVYDNKELQFYHDGVLVDVSETLSLSNSPGNMFIGQYLHGLIDDIYVYDRALGSDEILELYNASSSCSIVEAPVFKLVSGSIFNDFNGNNIFDGNDFYLDNFNLEFQPSGINSSTNQLGYFSQLLDSGTIQTLTIPIGSQDEWSFSIAQNPFDLTNYTSDTLDLGFIGIKPIEKIMVGVLNTSFPATIAHSRNGECSVNLKNDGNVIMNGNLKVTVSGQQLLTKFIYPSNHSLVTLNDSTIQFSYPVNNLIPLDSFITGFTIFSQAPANSKVHINYEYNDVSGYTLSGSYEVTIVAPHDPNYIAVDHEKIYKQFITDFNQLAYTVHFQNMGSAPAENVVIRQIVPKELKSDYIYVIGASAPTRLDKVQTGEYTELVWTFENINLPTLTEDSIKSTGYVSFSMFPETIEKDDSIILEADIYFDSQPAVNTNEAITSLICKTPTNQNMVDFNTFDALCFGDQTGGLLMHSNIDTAAISITMSNGTAIQFTTDSLKMAAGNYLIKTTDELGCSQVQAITIKQPSKLNSSIIDLEGGIKELVIGGGTPPYSILWQGGYTGYDLDKLPFGINNYTITDANGCELEGVYEKETLKRKDEVVPDIKVFPNPTSSILHIHWPNSTFNVTVLDLRGNILMRTKLNSEVMSIDISDLEPQLYFLKLTDKIGKTGIVKFEKI